MTKFYVGQTGLFSPAMVRIEKALKASAPPWAEIVQTREEADVVALYVIGADYIQKAAEIGKPYIAIQCCYITALGELSAWADFWHRALFMWSYYDLSPEQLGIDTSYNFMHFPLGVDAPFRAEYALLPDPTFTQRNTVITTGHLHGDGAEAIEEVWRAAKAYGYQTIHVGAPKVHGTEMKADRHLVSISDADLALIYSRAAYVAALRHCEGFELPAAEALCCGTRAVLFDQPALRRWYPNSAIFVPECSGDALVSALSRVFSQSPTPMSRAEHDLALERFSWEGPTYAFWSFAGLAVEAGAA